jgi:hypothetical protein
MPNRAALLASVILLASTVTQADAAGFATFFADVAPTGATSNSSGVHKTSRIAVGVYDVTFTRLVADCGYTASVSGATGGFATANRTSGRTITVSTFSKTGVATNLASNLIVVCAP